MGFEDTLDPEVATLLAQSPFRTVDFGTIEPSDLPALRAAMAAMPRPVVAPRDVTSRDHLVPGGPGQPDGADPAGVVIGGASAGGGLAAGLAPLARDRAEVTPACQLLIHPMIDDRNATASSRLAPPAWSRDPTFSAGGPISGPTRQATTCRSTRRRPEPPCSPVRPGVHRRRGPDVFRDEDMDYAARLLAAGVPTEAHVYPGAPDGFEVMAIGAAVSRRRQRDIDEAPRSALGWAAG